MGVAYPRPGPEVRAGRLPCLSKRREGARMWGRGRSEGVYATGPLPANPRCCTAPTPPGAALTILDSTRPLVPAAPAAPTQEAATFSAMRVRTHVGAIFRLSALAREGAEPARRGLPVGGA